MGDSACQGNTGEKTTLNKGRSSVLSNVNRFYGPNVIIDICALKTNGLLLGGGLNDPWKVNGGRHKCVREMRCIHTHSTSTIWKIMRNIIKQ